jgi:hypothetical protein
MSRTEFIVAMVLVVIFVLLWLRWIMLPTSAKTPEAKLYRQISKECPLCHCSPPVYAQGPSGGKIVNIFCTKCGQGYNVAKGMEWAQKIHLDKRYIIKPEKPKW